MKKIFCLIIIFNGFVCLYSFELNSVFTDNMVVPAEQSFILNGKSTSGRTITVEIARKRYQSVADTSGYWSVKISSLKVSNTPFSIKFYESHDILKKPVLKMILRNVVAGDLYIAAGQSNMLFEFGKSTGYDSIKNDSVVRFCKIAPGKILPGKGLSGKKINSFDSYFKNSGWKSIKGLAKNDMSAVGYIAADIISDSVKRPVGVIQISAGGSPIEAFLPREEVNKIYKSNISWIDNLGYPYWCRIRGRELLGNVVNSAYYHFAPESVFSIIKKYSSLPVKGFIFYQGESNAPEASFPYYAGGYEIATTELKYRSFISQMRDLFNPKLPVFLVQLPALDRVWALFREMQEKICAIDGVHLVPSLDTGEKSNVHPSDKSLIGQRIAELILKKIYKQTIDFNVPKVSSYRIENNNIIISFTDCSSLVSSDGKNIRGFEISSKDAVFYNANASIHGNNITINCNKVDNPVFFRYAWSGFPQVNLIDSDSRLPVLPYRNYNFNRIKIACVGDSITYGYGLKNRREDSYPSILQNLLGEKFYVGNFGYSGSCINLESVKNNKKRAYLYTEEFQKSLLFDPDVIILNLGINDIMDWHKFAAKRFIDDYLFLMKKYKENNSNVKIVMWSPIAPLFKGQKFYNDSGVEEINFALKQIALLSDVTVLNMRRPLLGKDNFFPDNLHPDKNGTALIAQFTAELLLKEMHLLRK
jgi:sialate O-acetylesterase